MTVGIQSYHDISILPGAGMESGLERGAYTAILRMRYHYRTGNLSLVNCFISATIINHDYRIHMFFYISHDSPYSGFLIERRNECHNFH